MTEIDEYDEPAIPILACGAFVMQSLFPIPNVEGLSEEEASIAFDQWRDRIRSYRRDGIVSSEERCAGHERFAELIGPFSAQNQRPVVPAQSSQTLTNAIGTMIPLNDLTESLN